MIIERISKFFDKDIADEFRERISNPFFVALFFSWVAWNWELLFMLFNFDPTTALWEKIACIKEYVDKDTYKWRLLWSPVIYSMGAILLFSLLRQISLLINLIIINWVQPFIYKKVGSSKIVPKERFEKVTKKVSRLREAYETMVDDVNDMSEENQTLRLNIQKVKEEKEEYHNRYDEAQEKYDQLTKNSLEGVFEGRWLNEFIFPDGRSGDVSVEIKEGAKYFTRSELSLG